MFEIGDSLREARTRRGLSLTTSQKGLRIRERYLTALEEERWELLPGEAYTKGFLRTYAEFLGLDGNLYVDEYNERIAAHEDEPLVPDSLAPSRGPEPAAHAHDRRRRRRRGPSSRRSARSAPARRRARRSRPTCSNVANAARPRKPVAAPTPRSRDAARAPSKPTVALIRAVTARWWLSVRIGGPNGQRSSAASSSGTQRSPTPARERVGAHRPPARARDPLGNDLVRGLPGDAGEPAAHAPTARAPVSPRLRSRARPRARRPRALRACSSRAPRA